MTADVEEQYKTMLRDELSILEENLENFNEFALTFVDIEDLRQKISDIRWYVSHNYFEKGRPKPDEKDGKSKPPVTWLYSQVHGQTVPIARDIARCIEPVVSSSLLTEQAAKRIYNALTYPLYNYVTPEAAKADQEATYKRRVLDKLDLKKKADYERQRRHRAEREKKRLTPEQMEKKGEEYLKEKNRQREREQLKRQRALEETQKTGRGIRQRMKEEMKKRRKEFGN